jgi:hypothetical protein
MRDTGVGRNYSGLKLACWLTQDSYWENTLTEGQTFNLIERTLNHPEVNARWPELTEIDVLFPTRGTTAWAERKRNGKGLLSLPKGTHSPLIILHEIAHLLPTTKRESDHGAGFTAIHMMLVELMSPKSLPALVAAYHATHTRYDASLIPAPTTPSQYVPIASGAPLNMALGQLRSLLASGTLTASERRKTEEALKRLKRKDKGEQPTLHSLPLDVRVKTQDLLRCNTPEQIAKLVLNEIREELIPDRMRKTKNIGGK